jgi:hypothetical protein
MEKLKSVRAMNLAECKGERIRLLNLISSEDYDHQDVERLRQVSNKIRNVESFALWGIVGVLLFFLGFMHGCATFEGVKADIHWLTADVPHNTISEK